MLFFKHTCCFFNQSEAKTKSTVLDLAHFQRFEAIDNIRILAVELELACNRGLCGGISLKTFAFEKIPPHEPRLQASSSPTMRIAEVNI